MCGIAGFIQQSIRTGPEALEAAARRMADQLKHRGPDDAGTWVDAESGVALAHRRLSIVDLSPAGHQPMRSADARFVVVFNGEIYNFDELRRELAQLGHSFRGDSDTEVLLAAVQQWTVQGALERFVGMFAFALWDRQDRVLTLARDRMGEKPLYYGWLRGAFVFASELKAFSAHGGWQGELNRDVLAAYFSLGYVPGPYSIYRGIFKLIPGGYLQLSGSAAGGTLPEPVTYWSLRDVAVAGVRRQFSGPPREAVTSLDKLLRDAVAKQMVADVPIGAFLSGGIDSSVIVALMQAQSARPVRTFSIGFHEKAYNEADRAAAVAAHLGTEHTELYVSSEQAMSVIERLPELYDEPFADSSSIPTFLVAQMARQHVTVSLSGDAGDELFGGYSRYAITRKLWNVLRWMPPGLRQSVGRAAQKKNDSSFVRQSSGGARKGSRLFDRFLKITALFQVRSADELYMRLMSHWKNASSLVLDSRLDLLVEFWRSHFLDLPELLERMTYLDSGTYLPDNILVKVDRASMGVSLESRIPLLDHRVVEFAWQLPVSMKLRNGQSKWILREVLHQYVPRPLIERPKMGFGVPIGTWLRGPLRSWAEDLLEPGRLKQEGFLQTELVQAKWKEHLAGWRNWQYYLWDILMFQAWLRSSGVRRLAPPQR